MACICQYERVHTNDLCHQHGRGSKDEFGDPGPIPPHRDFENARSLVTKRTPCYGCGKTMADEFIADRFDGVMNNRLQAFHHGCEDF